MSWQTALAKQQYETAEEAKVKHEADTSRALQYNTYISLYDILTGLTGLREEPGPGEKVIVEDKKKDVIVGGGVIIVVIILIIIGVKWLKK